jgi:hypothetical protein
MTTIKTTIPVLYFSRSQHTSVVEFEIISFEEIKGGGVNVTVGDYVYRDKQVTDENNEIVTVTNREQFCTTSVTLSKEKVDELSLSLLPLLPSDCGETDRRDLLKKYALLAYIQNDFLPSSPDRCVYGLLPNQFEFKE